MFTNSSLVVKAFANSVRKSSNMGDIPRVDKSATINSGAHQISPELVVMSVPPGGSRVAYREVADTPADRNSV
jgi:hypothetical protein